MGIRLIAAPDGSGMRFAGDMPREEIERLVSEGWTLVEREGGEIREVSIDEACAAAHGATVSSSMAGDPRFDALLALMKATFEPALMLLPSQSRAKARTLMEAFEDAVKKEE